jgi:L-lactate dehydrogenase complex protein LldF
MFTQPPETESFFAESCRTVRDADLRRKLENAVGRHLEHVALVAGEFPDYEREKAAARRIKEEAISRLPELLEQLKHNLEAKGARVFFAAEAAEARNYVLALARSNGVKLVVKGKSMAAEEIELNSALEQAGIEVVETDLGEYIVQLRGERPSHIITPAIHLSKEDVGRLFQQKLGTAYSDVPEELAAVARERLRAKFLAADMGVVGANFAIAETGSIVLVENEGNGRLTTALPEVAVVIMGIEKVIPRAADLSHFMEILGRTATGQKLTAYVNFVNGVRRASELDGPRELHVVVLDNGRSQMLADPVLREALYCLRCGACLNVCPIFRRIGGHAYGTTYPGPIGSIISPSLVHNGHVGHLAFASTLCGACKDICPVKINIPRILLHLRWRATEGDINIKWPPAQRRVRAAARLTARLFAHPALTRILSRAASTFLRPFARDGYLRWLPPPFDAWTQSRDFPLLGARHNGATSNSASPGSSSHIGADRGASGDDAKADHEQAAQAAEQPLQ